jgi:myo-inositol 2-dehydrogenase/D-chiro-inositol 1-dehydrogenase
VSTLGIGLIGCGGMGRSLGKQLLDIPQARLAGVADPNPEAVAQAAAELGAPGYATAEALLEQPEVEAVIIASPGYLHRPLAELAASRGKHLFVEKPLATNTVDCDAILAAAERGGVLLMVGQVLRYYACWWKTLEMVRSGEIGTPLGITVTRIGGGFGGWPQAWRNSLAQSGGLLMEVNAHEIDFMCQVCGDVRRVYAEADHYGTEDPSDYPNLYFVALRFASGAVGMLHSSTVSAIGELSGKVQGSEGTIVYTGGFAGGEIRRARRDGEVQVLPIGEIQVENPVRKELRLFVEAVRNGTPSPIPGIEGRRNVAIAEAAYESARTGRPVEL